MRLITVRSLPSQEPYRLNTLAPSAPAPRPPPPTSPSTIYQSWNQPPRPDTVCMTHHYHHSCHLWVIYEYTVPFWPDFSACLLWLYYRYRYSCCMARLSVCLLWLYCLHGSIVCLLVCCGCTLACRPVGLNCYGVLLSLSAVVVLLYFDLIIY